MSVGAIALLSPFVIAFVIVILLKLFPAPERAVVSARPLPEPVREKLEDLQAVKEGVAAWVRDLGLTVELSRVTGNGEVEVLGVDPRPVLGGRYLFWYVAGDGQQPIKTSRIRALSEAVKSEGAMKGILLTGGPLSAEAALLADKKSVAAYDGTETGRLLASYL